MTILQLQNNSNEVVKSNCISSLSSWSCMAEFPSELQDLTSKRCLNSYLVLTLLCCPAQDMIRAVSWQRVVRKCWGCTGFSPQLCSSMGYFIMLQSLHDLTVARCFQSWLHGGSSVPCGAEMGLLPQFSFQLCLFCCVTVHRRMVLASAPWNFSQNRSELLCKNYIMDTSQAFLFFYCYIQL